MVEARSVGRYQMGSLMVATVVVAALATSACAPVPTAPTPDAVFRDCPKCPEMVVVPAGKFRMGSNTGDSDERPVHSVTIASAFALGKYEVTFDEWDACVADGGCKGYRPFDQYWGRGNRPVIGLSWIDANEYASWLSRETNHRYRLPSEAEWEYAARAGTTTEYWWGNNIGANNANCDGCGSRWDSLQTAPVGSFRANRFGLHDMLGNVREWVHDCELGGGGRGYRGVPTDGSAVVTQSCLRRVLRGGSFYLRPGYIRSAERDRSNFDFRYSHTGFRVARTVRAEAD